MKFCPTCETRYDEEILRFCMKDGTPLVDEEEPNFVGMPSESLDVPDEDDPSEITIVRKNPTAVPSPPPSDDDEAEEISGEYEYEPIDQSSPRIVVPMTTVEPPGRHEPVVSAYVPPPQKSNTILVVLLTMIGTTALLALGAGLFWLFSARTAVDPNANYNGNFANENLDLNTNFDLESNFNFNTNSNFNSDLNTNAAPSPSPSPSPTPSPTRTPVPAPTETAEPEETPEPTPPPVRTPIPTPTPVIIRPGSSPTPRPVPSPENN